MMAIKENRKNINLGISDYFYAIMVIMLSGNPVFSTGSYGALFVTFIVILFLSYKKEISRAFVNIRVTIIFGVLLIQYFIQLVVFDSYSVNSILSLVSNLVISLIVAVHFKNKFIYLYVKIIYGFAVISLGFYFIFLIFPDLYYFTLNNIAPYFELPGSSAGYSYHNNILIYTFATAPTQNIFDYRNAGPFWEPGAFSIYLNIAILINIYVLRKNWISIKNIILLIAVLTTYSLAGWLILFIILAGYYNFIKGRKNQVIRMIPLLIAYVFYFAYETLPFLGEKYEIKKTTYEKAIHNETKMERVGSFYRDTYLLMEYPILGYGMDPINKNPYYTKGTLLYNHRNNGTSDLLLSFGLPLGIYYMFIISQITQINHINGLYRSKFFSIYMFLIVFLLGFSQIILLKPVFVIMFWLVFYKRHSQENEFKGAFQLKINNAKL